MSRVALPVMPFAGHVTPMLGVAAELVRRDHEVIAYTGSRYAARFTALGCRWEPWRHAPDFDDARLPAASRWSAGGGLQAGSPLGQRATLRLAGGQVRDLLALDRRTSIDAVVTDQLAVGGLLAAELLDVPAATVAVVPLLLGSRHLPPPGAGLRPGRTPAGRARDALLRGVARAADRISLDPLVAAARAEAGLPRAATRGLDSLFSPQLVLAQGVAELDLARPDPPESVRYVGRLAAPTGVVDGPALPSWWPDVERAHAEGRPVVLVSQGTVHVDPDDLIRPALAALAGSSALVLVTTGRHAGPGVGPLPANARVADFLPYDALLPMVDVMVSNGGWSSVLTALAEGIPLVLAPAGLDKPEVGCRVAFSGAGIDLRTRRPHPDLIRAACDQLVADAGPRAAAARIARDLAAAGGSSRAADLIDAVIGTAPARSPHDRHRQEAAVRP